MIRTFLKAKHWHLFIITFALPMFIYTFAMNMMVTKVSGNPYSFNDTPEIDPEMMLETMMSYFTSFMQIFSIIMVLVVLTMYGWYWAVGVGLQKKVPENAKMNLTKFKFFYFTSLIYSLFFTGLMAWFSTYLPDLISGNARFSSVATSITASLPIFMIVSLLAVFAMFYCMYFAAKTIKTIELQAEPTFSSFIGEFLMIWFFFIGVWILQPKINAFVEEKVEGGEDMDWLDGV